MSWRVTCTDHEIFRLLKKMFLWIHKEVDLAPHPVVDLVLQVEVRRSFLRHLISKAWFLFFSQRAGPCFTAIEEDGGDKRFVELELACGANGDAPPDPVQSGHC